MKRLLLIGLATLPLVAAGPPNSFLTVTPLPEFGAGSARKKAPAAPPQPGEFTAAPTPNHDLVAPTPGSQSTDASVSPSFFSRNNHAQSDGYLPSSSFQAETDRRARPGAGLNLSMPLQ